MEKGGCRCWAGSLHDPRLPAATGQGRALAVPHLSAWTSLKCISTQLEGNPSYSPEK